MKNVCVEDSTLLVTADVESLYTNIKQKDALDAIKWSLHKHTKLKQSQIVFLVERLNMAMSNNFFWYGGDFFNQVKGVAMGAKYPPSVANIFLDKWENEDIFTDEWPQLMLNRRYIDDLVFIWEGSLEDLHSFMTHMNNNQYGIKLTSKWSVEKIQYLDLKLFYRKNRLLTRTFFKEVDKNGYISTRSCRQPGWIKAIPKGQFVWIRRNCDLDDDYWAQSEVLMRRFLEKGYTFMTLRKSGWR